ncbi:hypothetical protein EC973_002334 [Apophysomyces ossiformis]|uniref:Equilibrative nucleoside transporter n=1 Tax=Apophysomyces ossiformis TaxID=679940 RepID=A0A8H7EMZ9_9FUNG|nr:hypothetical protein EC973_002334 [Apophysomyces ossiformis]
MFEFCKAKAKTISSKLWGPETNEEVQGLLQQNGEDTSEICTDDVHDKYCIVYWGSGLAGAAAALSSIISALAGKATDVSSDDDAANSALIYFLIALAITATALVGRFVLTHNAFYIRYMTMETSEVCEVASDNECDEDLEDPNSIFDAESSMSAITIAIKSAGLLFAVGYVFFVTLAVFPSITAFIKSVRRHDPYPPSDPAFVRSRSRFFDDDIFVAFHFLLFNVGDFLGRSAPIWKCFQMFNTTGLILMSVARTVFIPAFLLCNVVVSGQRQWPVIVDNDWVYFLLVWLFAVTNGWLGSLTMMAAPHQSWVRNSGQKSLIGSFMTFSLITGLAIGGAFSFVVRWML